MSLEAAHCAALVLMREFLRGRAGVVVGAALLVLAAVVLFSVLKSPSGEPGFMSGEVVFVDATTGKGFNHDLVKGETVPVIAPSGQKSGYPAELCYWTTSGDIRKDPYPVLLNMTVGKPGPTFCPDCGRLVVARNPVATVGMKPPPTKDEYEKSHSASKTATNGPN